MIIQIIMAENNSKLTSAATTNSAAAKVEHHGVRKYLIVWVDANATTSTEDSQRTLEQLRSVINDVTLISQPEECIKLLESIRAENVFLVASGALGRGLVPSIHMMAKVYAIYIFCGDKSRHVEWVKDWPKVKGVHTQIKHICNDLQLAMKQCNQNCTTPRCIAVGVEDGSGINFNQLEPSFMYTKLFKKTLLGMEHDWKKALQDLVTYCEKAYASDPKQLKLVAKFHHDYHPDQAIWWYTQDSFIHKMLNRALRLLEADIVVNMGFFIHDLHQQLKQEHQAQVGKYGGKPFLVYRGQGLSTADFKKLTKSKGDLMSFNYFLSTSMKKKKSIEFAEEAAQRDDTVGILFVMAIDPTIEFTPFADVQEMSCFKKEAEILFSMHTVFRIDAIKSQDQGKTYVEVNLSLTEDDDEQLRKLMEQIDDDIQASNAWERMGKLLIEVGHPIKAEEFYKTLLEQTTDPLDQGRYYHHLGYIKDQQGDFKEALYFYERAFKIQQSSLPTDHRDLAASYNNIGMVYRNMGDYSKALSFLEQALAIRQRNFPASHPQLATSYNNIGLVYKNMGEHSKALSFYERALEIRQKRIPANHPELAISYNNIGSVYQSMGDYPKALSYYKKDLEISEKTLPSNHSDLATSYNNMGLVHHSMGDHSKALSFYDKAITIWKKCLPPNHPNLKTVIKNKEMLEMKSNKT